MRLFPRHQKGVTEVTDRITLREDSSKLRFLYGARLGFILIKSVHTV
jgi:hypothetical protein